MCIGTEWWTDGVAQSSCQTRNIGENNNVQHQQDSSRISGADVINYTTPDSSVAPMHAATSSNWQTGNRTWSMTSQSRNDNVMAGGDVIARTCTAGRLHYTGVATGHSSFSISRLINKVRRWRSKVNRRPLIVTSYQLSLCDHRLQFSIVLYNDR